MSIFNKNTSLITIQVGIFSCAINAMEMQITRPFVTDTAKYTAPVRGKNRSHYKHESDSYIEKLAELKSACFMKEWNVDSDNKLLFPLDARLIFEANQVIEEVKRWMGENDSTYDDDYDRYIYEPTKQERKVLISIWLVVRLWWDDSDYKDYRTGTTVYTASTESNPTGITFTPCDNTRFGLKFERDKTMPTVYSINGSPLTIHPKKQTVAAIHRTKDINGNDVEEKIIIKLSDLMKVYGEVFGTWLNRHGAFLNGMMPTMESGSLDRAYRYFGVDPHQYRDRDSLWQAISKSYYKLAGQLHPDKKPKEEEAVWTKRFQTLGAYYEQLVKAKDLGTL